VVADSSEELLSVAVNDFIGLLSDVLDSKPVANIVLTGGSLGVAFIGEIAKLELDL